jgi:hypothetical protein
VELELWCAWVVARVDRIGGCLYNFKGVVWLGQAHVVRLNHPDMSTLEIEGIASSLQCENISEVSGCGSVFKRDMMKLIKYVINYSFFFFAICLLCSGLNITAQRNNLLMVKQYT